MVCHTRFHTAKGQLLASMLHPQVRLHMCLEGLQNPAFG